jgi:DNA-directed RNA polymerase subunit RPC12/RpoP
MRRAYWSIDFFDAQIVADFLREQGIEAWVFDVELIRQDWLYAMALGGFRVVTADADQAQAVECIARWRAGEFALTPNDIDEAQCPRCGSHASEADPWPRRAGFVALNVFVAAMLFIRYRSRYRCRSCSRRWTATPETYSDLAARVDAAEASNE